MKQVIVTFDFDPETDTVTNVKCSVDGSVTKKKTTKSKSKTSIESDIIEIIREDNKLVLSSKAAELLQVSPDDRIIIEYAKDKSKKPIPIIGSDFAFDKEGQGNKLTKSLTVAYRGNANKILSEFGTTFSLEEYKEGLFRLIDSSVIVENDTDINLDEVIKNNEADLIVEDTEEIEIDEKLSVGNLKFDL